MSTSLSLKTRLAAADIVEKLPARGTRALAEPPAGSQLKPVMGEAGLPLVGNTFPLLQHTLRHSRLAYERHGAVSWGNALRTDFVLVLGPEATGEVLANRDQAFSSEHGWGQLIGPFFERGVMLMDGEEHRHNRRIMQQAFTRPRLTGYLGRMNEVIARRTAEWQPADDFAVYPAAKRLTLDIATEVFMGAEAGAETDRLSDAFIDVITGGQAIIRSDVPGGKWHRGLSSRHTLAEYFRAQIPAKRESEGDDLFSVLCNAETDDGDRFTDDDIVNQMIFTMMAAHDTSTTSISMMTFHLARHPEWQKRLREESEMLGRRSLDYGDLEQLPSLDLVFKETLRMNPPAGILARMAMKDTEISGHYVPEGTLVLLGLYPTHRMEPWWNAPDTFDPQRFSEERAEDKRQKDVWMPFGGNVHKCIGMHFGGMEVKAVMHQLLLQYEFDVDPSYEPVIDFGTGPFPADGLPLKLSASV